MSKRFDLNVEPRQAGRSNSREIRESRKVPAVIYGAVKENTNVTIEANAVIKYNTRAHENALFNLKSSDSKINNIVVLLKEVTVNPLSRRPEHVDLFALDLKKPVRVSIEIKLEGKPIGIAEGGLLNVVTRTIDIECLPTEIPESFTADISGLGVGDALHVSDIKVPEGTRVLSPADLTIAVVNLFVEEVIAAPEAAAAAAPGAAPAAGAPAAAGAAPAAGAKKEEAKPAAKK